MVAQRLSLVSMLFLALVALLAIGAQDLRPLHAAPAPGPNYVLILDSSVTGGAGSREAAAAVAAGYSVEVATDADWAAKTTADFATYRALILGDDTCRGIGTAPSITAAEANNAVWAPAVTGNVFINGTDPVFHQSQGGDTMTFDGVQFAADATGPGGAPKTGLYASLSCYYHDTAPGTPVPVLNNLSVIPGATFTVKGVGCHNNVHIVATHPALQTMTDATLSDWFCSVHEAFDTWPADFDVLAIAEGTGLEFTASDGSQGTPYVLARGVTSTSCISLTPETAINPVGTSHTLTVSARTAPSVPECSGPESSPAAGIVITFTVEAGPNTGVTGTCTTAADGTCTFTYTSNGTEGTDIIRARGTINNLLQTSNQAQKTWEIPPVTNVVIDIKPGSFPNSIKLSNNGVIPVAILSTSTFDATTVDPSTVCFGDAEAPAERDCTEAHSTGHIQDADGDGDLDLVLHYETGQTGIDHGDTQACLTGTTFGGTAIEGCDSVRTLAP